jgi:hypothetical protein
MASRSYGLTVQRINALWLFVKMTTMTAQSPQIVLFQKTLKINISRC